MQEFKSSETIIQFTEAETDKAFQLARQKQLPVLIDFWSPGCKGCKKWSLSPTKVLKYSLTLTVISYL